MKKKLFPDDYLYLNDTLCIARIIEPIGNNDYKPSVARWNMATGEINPMPYEYFQFAVIRYKEAAVRLVDSNMAYNCNLTRTLSLICTAGKMFECVFVKQMNEFVR